MICSPLLAKQAPAPTATGVHRLTNKKVQRSFLNQNLEPPSPPLQKKSRIPGSVPVDKLLFFCFRLYICALTEWRIQQNGE